MSSATSTWRVVGASVEGSGHVARGEGCQDAHLAVVLEDGTLLVAVADGAGSATWAAEGAKLAVAVAIDALDEARAAGGPINGIDGWPQMLAGSITAARTALEMVAGDGVEVGDLATTLLVVAVTADVVAAAQVGDGAVVVRRGDQLDVLGPVDRGEYLNETTFLTSGSWADALRVDCIPAEDVTGIAVLSDGLQLLALDLAAGTAHAPFFTPLYDFAASEEPSVAELAAFLASDRVCARTDDDKTIVLAVRA